MNHQRTEDKATTNTVVLCGLDAVPTTVEAEVHSGTREFNLVGVPELTAREVYVRVKLALRGHLGVNLRHQRVKTFKGGEKETHRWFECDGWGATPELAVADMIEDFAGVLAKGDEP